MKPSTLLAYLTLLAIGSVATSKDATSDKPIATDDASVFGALEMAYTGALSADGKRMVFVGPGGGTSTIAVVIDLVDITLTQAARADGKPIRITGCDWSAADRLVCSLYGLTRENTVVVPITRTLALDADGKNQLSLGQKNTAEQLYGRQFDGGVVDWLDGAGGSVLMSRSHVPEATTGRLLGRVEKGMGVDKVDTRTGKATSVERPGSTVEGYISDGLGNVRIMTSTAVDASGNLRGIITHFYRTTSDRNWRELGSNIGDGADHPGMIPLAVDPIVNSAYVLQPLNGRLALYRISLDGSLKRELVFASKEVDVDNVVRVGRNGRVIGASYTTDRAQAEYFDPAYKTIHTMLSRALPKLPLIHFISASADEQVLLVGASSDVDPGHWYIFDRVKKTLGEAIAVRPTLKGKTLAVVRAITFPAGDGTQVPGYLTLPPGVTDAKGLPAIVLPHGGPGARDEWGFDWLSQFFAQRGYAVLQPNFRGSTGYGDQWYVNNGFQSWKLSVGDVCDGGRWLVAQGIADSSKLAVLGWSYGGYAALQANVLDSKLFKAVVAIAPVTDLALFKNQAMAYTNSALVAEFVGSGPHIKEGSPAQNAQAFSAPVLMFHGDIDLNVDIAQSRKMDKELRSAGKSSQLVVYPDLDHSLRDGTARADMLRKADAFLRANLKL